MIKDSVHKTVLLNETIAGLNLQPGARVLDCTFGGGGHSLLVCQKVKDVELVALDQDKDAWERAKDKFKNCKIKFQNINFREISDENTFDGIIFDLGLSSDQLEASERGFTFLKDEPLLMTMKANPKEEDLSAQDIVNTWSEESLADIIYGYGEERYAKRISRAIVEKRKVKKIETTFELIEIIKGSVPKSYQHGKIHYATRTFQALRIAVNDELETLRMGLAKAFQALKGGGRMSVISFHSLEDRIVKNFYKEKVKEGRANLVNKKPIIPEAEEIKNNSRSRSAKLRIIEKLK